MVFLGRMNMERGEAGMQVDADAVIVVAGRPPPILSIKRRLAVGLPAQPTGLCAKPSEPGIPALLIGRPQLHYFLKGVAGKTGSSPGETGDAHLRKGAKTSNRSHWVAGRMLHDQISDSRILWKFIMHITAPVLSPNSEDIVA